jgi:hypothetical protein
MFTQGKETRSKSLKVSETPTTLLSEESSSHHQPSHYVFYRTWEKAHLLDSCSWRQGSSIITTSLGYLLVIAPSFNSTYSIKFFYYVHALHCIHTLECSYPLRLQVPVDHVAYHVSHCHILYLSVPSKWLRWIKINSPIS